MDNLNLEKDIQFSKNIKITTKPKETSLLILNKYKEGLHL